MHPFSVYFLQELQQPLKGNVHAVGKVLQIVVELSDRSFQKIEIEQGGQLAEVFGRNAAWPAVCK